MKLVISLLKVLIIYILNFLGRLIPRSHKIWLYGGFSDRFIDNSKYFFISVNETKKDIRHIWLTNSMQDESFLKEKGFECYQRKSIKGIYFALRAKVYIFSCYPSDVASFSLSGGAYLFNLWHGLPLKKIEYDIKSGVLKKQFYPQGVAEFLYTYSNQPPFFRNSSSVLCPLISFIDIFKSAFKLIDSNICVANYPRTAPFSWDEPSLMAHIEKYEPLEMKFLIDRCKQYKKVWIYMPTWRDANPNFINEAIPDFIKLDEICKKNGVLFLMKLHLATNITFDVTKWENILVVPNHFDVYPLLPFTTTLLTDYSSVFLDYQLLNKKIVFYPYDLEEYLSNSREMYFEYDELAVGYKVYSFSELINLLESEIFLEEYSSSEGLKLNENKESEKIVNFIKDKINR